MESGDTPTKPPEKKVKIEELLLVPVVE